MSVARRRIRGTHRIVHIVSFSNWSNVVVTNTFRQVDKARRLTRKYSTCIGSIIVVTNSFPLKWIKLGDKGDNNIVLVVEVLCL